MDWTPLLSAAPPIPTHAVTAGSALGLGAAQLVLAKGTPRHVWMGRGFVLALAYVAASGLFIPELRVFAPFSPIHVLSIVTLASLYSGVRAARRGDVARHRRTMLALFAIALVATGLFTLWPGRIMHTALFGG